VNHIYGENEMGGTAWLYLSAVAFKDVGMREDLGVTPAPKLTAGALSVVPVVAGLWPVLLTGIYAINQRKEKIERLEKEEAVAAALETARTEAEAKLSEAMEKAEKEKAAAIETAVSKALQEAASASEEAAGDSAAEDADNKPSEEDS
jgi:hypothetical protein